MDTVVSWQCSKLNDVHQSSVGGRDCRVLDLVVTLKSLGWGADCRLVYLL